MVSGNVLRIADQHQVRGTTERVYALTQESFETKGSKLEKEDLSRYFLTYLAAIHADFERFIKYHDHSNREQLHFIQSSMYLTSEEHKELVESISSIMNRFAENPHTSNRQKYTIYSVSLPNPKANPSNQ
jgi:hypothetical protein